MHDNHSTVAITTWRQTVWNKRRISQKNAPKLQLGSQGLSVTRREEVKGHKRPGKRVHCNNAGICETYNKQSRLAGKAIG